MCTFHHRLVKMGEQPAIISKTFPRWLRILAKSVAAIVVLFVSSYLILAWYVNNHKEELLSEVTATLNESLTGTLAVESMEPTFLTGFPQFSLNLKNVSISDSLYPKHRKLLLNAEDFTISVNVVALLRGAIVIRKINISNGEINLFTDAAGYSNGNVFKKRASKKGGQTDYPELSKFSLKNVKFSIDNLNKKKKFQFDIEKLNGDVEFDWNGWEADINLKLRAKSLAFNTKKGSFMEGKIVEGRFKASFDNDRSTIIASSEALDIGGEVFDINAAFDIGKTIAGFEFHIKNEEILWKNASVLLSKNISSRLDMFAMTEPLSVTCAIVGDFNAPGDPLITVKAKIRDNILDTPGGIVTNCNFDGEFTNRYDKKLDLNDANSAILIRNFTGNYAGSPIKMQKTAILNFEHPIAIGDFTSDVDLKNINNVVNVDLLDFSRGTAQVQLQYKADIVNYQLSKPIIIGSVDIKNTDVKYVPRNLSFKDISVKLQFEKDNLSIGKINFKVGKSVINMEGNVKNFLNLYYTNPETIVLDWNVYAPKLYLQDFIGFIGTKKKNTVNKQKVQKGNFTEELNTIFDKSNVAINLKVDQLYYNTFYASNATANLLLTDSDLLLKNAALKHAGGSMKVEGKMVQHKNSNSFALNAVVSRVDIKRFFQAFSNFGLTSLKSTNLRGFLSTTANITGKITDNGQLIPKSMLGDVAFNLQKGALINFEPVKSVGKFAFPFRDFNSILIQELDGALEIKREKVTITPMQINSSVINMDIQGIYSFGTGTEIFIDVPIRNPQRDKNITDEAELAKRRNRGIVIHLKASDDSDGKVKVKLGGKNKD